MTNGLGKAGRRRPWTDRWRARVAAPLLALCAASLVGCTHLHDPAAAKLAAETSDKFTEFRTASGGIYARMIANTAAFERERDEARARQAETEAAAFATALSSYTWDALGVELDVLESSRRAHLDDLASRIKVLTDSQTALAADIPTLKRALDSARGKVEGARTAKNKWNARQVLFRQAIQVLVDATTTTDDKGEGSGDLAGKAEQVLDAPVVVEVVQNGRPTTRPSTVGDVLKDDLTGLRENLNFESLLKEYVSSAVDPKAAPGITIVVLGLGADLAEAAVRRAERQMTLVEDTLALYAAELGREEAAEGTLNAVRNDFRQIVGAANRERERTVLADLQASRNDRGEFEGRAVNTVLGHVTAMLAGATRVIEFLNKNPEPQPQPQG